MSKPIPSGSTAVMSRRTDPVDSLDFLPTPPWGTRALMQHVLRPWECKGKSAWEPAAGEGHMAEVLQEYFHPVHASDVHDYGRAPRGYVVGSFIGVGFDVASWPADLAGPHWIVTNPPFSKALEFAERALGEAHNGVALLLRTVWVESEERWAALFRDRPPSVIAQFSERLPMHEGRWDPNGSTATSYAWFVWRLPLNEGQGTRLMWIPPGQRQALEKADDRRRFAYRAPEGEAVPLFETQPGEKVDAA